LAIAVFLFPYRIPPWFLCKLGVTRSHVHQYTFSTCGDDNFYYFLL